MMSKLKDLEELLPCPFCGTDNAYVSQVHGIAEGYEVRCLAGCLSISSSIEEATERWNKRTKATKPTIPHLFPDGVP